MNFVKLDTTGIHAALRHRAEHVFAHIIIAYTGEQYRVAAKYFKMPCNVKRRTTQNGSIRKYIR
jgi:hypothetical protein